MTVFRWRALTASAVALLAMSACELPRLHRVTVQQGNVITQDMVDKLSPGMTREQVAFVMGEPVLRNPFNADRWDYVYSLHIPGTPTAVIRMSLFFSGDVLSHLSGDYAPTGAEDESAGAGEAGEGTGQDT